MARFFKGGIHPLGKKESTRKKPLIVPEIAPSHIILPLIDSCGDELTPLVVSGEKVNLGGIVARPRKREKGVPMFSGVSGIVSEITPQPHPLFQQVMSIVIENDYQNTRQVYPAFLDPDELSQENTIGFFQERGLRGMSRDTRAVHEKVLEYRGKVDVLIINACECEPYLTSDYRLLLDRKDIVIAGAKLLATGMGASKIVVALQGDKLDAIEDVEKTLGWDRNTMSVRTLPTRYPLGEEKQVIRYVTGKELTRDEPCYKAHCCVFNIATAYAVGEAVLKGYPQTHRAFTVSGGAVKRPRNFWLPIGTPLNAVLENADGVREPPTIALLGGPMSGTAQRDLCAPVLVNSTGLLLLASWEVPNRLLKQTKPKFPCVRCGHCVTVCPKHLRPFQVYQVMNSPKTPKLQDLHPEECISCGCCTYRCPSHLPLASTMQKAEDLMRELEQEVVYKNAKPTFASIQDEDDVKIYNPEDFEDMKKNGGILSRRKKEKLRIIVPLSDVDPSILHSVFEEEMLLDEKQVKEEKYKLYDVDSTEKEKNNPESPQFTTISKAIVTKAEPLEEISQSEVSETAENVVNAETVETVAVDENVEKTEVTREEVAQVIEAEKTEVTPEDVAQVIEPEKTEETEDKTGEVAPSVEEVTVTREVPQESGKATVKSAHLGNRLGIKLDELEEYKENRVAPENNFIEKVDYPVKEENVAEKTEITAGISSENAIDPPTKTLNLAERLGIKIEKAEDEQQELQIVPQTATYKPKKKKSKKSTDEVEIVPDKSNEVRVSDEVEENLNQNLNVVLDQTVMFGFQEQEQGSSYEDLSTLTTGEISENPENPDEVDHKNGGDT